MTVVIRTPTRSVEVGPTLEILRAWGELGKIDPGESELAAVPLVGDEEMTDEWLDAVADQARQMLSGGEQMSSNLRGYLQVLVSHPTGGESGPKKLTKAERQFGGTL